MSGFGLKRVAVTCWLVTAVASCVPAVAWSCQVPVFRYALERWDPDRYLAVVVHDGSLKPTDDALVDRLNDAAANDESPVNLATRTVAFEELAEEDRQRLFGDSGPPGTYPWLVLVYPPDVWTRQVAWSGPLTDDVVARVVDSPARREVAKRLLAGDSAVLVLIESGDKQQDDAAAATLRDGLNANQEQLKLPDTAVLEADEFFQPQTSVELKLVFSLLRIRRDDPAESVFVSMLVNSEDDLPTTDEPLAFAVFGRGRSLFAMVGEGINADTIEDTCRFLTGPCSCQVKEQNPGADLLFAVNWQKHISESVMDQTQLPELTGIGSFVEAGATSSGVQGEVAATARPADGVETNGIESDDANADEVETGHEAVAAASYADTLGDAARESSKMRDSAPVATTAGHEAVPALNRRPLWISIATVVALGVVLVVVGTILIQRSDRSSE